MAMLTGKELLDNAISVIPNQDSGLRLLLLLWLNHVSTKLSINTIGWSCLEKTDSTLTVVDNQITLPSDFEKLICTKQNSTFFLDANDELSEEEEYTAAGLDRSGNPTRYAIDSEKITFYPAASGTVILKYIKQSTAIVDSTAATVWPTKFNNVFHRACLDFYYEYDMDIRAAMSYQLDNVEITLLEAWEISKRPLPQVDNTHGYMRGK